MSLSINSTVQLGTHQIPQLGYGVYEARGEECAQGVLDALKAGYLDSAQFYDNEDIVGKAVVDSGVPRSEVYLTTKYAPTDNVKTVDEVLETLRKSLAKIDPSDKSYIDLVLVHGPWGGKEGRASNWQALAQAQKEGWVREIGVSNFNVKHLEELPGPKPAVNQIQLHPWFQAQDIVDYCRAHDIVLQAYSPLVRARKEYLGNASLKQVSDKHGKEPAQILVRWSLQKGFVPLPKSVTPSRIASNADVYDFELDKEDMAALDALDQGEKGLVAWNPLGAEYWKDNKYL